MALGALISLSCRPEAPAEGFRPESKKLNLFRDTRPADGQPFPLPSKGVCRPKELAILQPGVRRDIGSACRRIADVEGFIRPHGVHDHRELANHRDRGFALAGALDLTP
jgi:hypothetical protein